MELKIVTSIMFFDYIEPYHYMIIHLHSNITSLHEKKKTAQREVT